MSNIVERLRDFDDECGDGFRMRDWNHDHECPDFSVMRLRRQAADEIEWLRQELDELRAAYELCKKGAKALGLERFDWRERAVRAEGKLDALKRELSEYAR